MLFVPLFGTLLFIVGLVFYNLNNASKKKNKSNNPLINPLADVSQDELGRFPLVFSKKPPVFLAELERYQHIQILGASGFGKTSRGILPAIYQDIHNGAGVFVLDVKSNMR